MKRQVMHMVKYRYLPFSWGKKVRQRIRRKRWGWGVLAEDCELSIAAKGSPSEPSILPA